MIKDLKDEAKKQINGIQLSLFIPIFITNLVGSLLSYTVIGSLLMFAVGYVSDIFMYKYITTGKRTFATAYEDFTTNLDNAAKVILAGLRMFLYNGIMLVVGLVISFVCLFGDNVILIILAVLVLLAVSIGTAILQFMFYFVPFILKDSDYKISAKDAFTLSNNMTNGRKMELLWLNLSFIGHFLLVVITFGIYTIWFTPYIMATKALYYERAKEDYLKTHKDILTSYIEKVEVADDHVDDGASNGSGAEFSEVEKLFENKSDSTKVDPFDNANGNGTKSSDPFDTTDVENGDPFIDTKESGKGANNSDPFDNKPQSNGNIPNTNGESFPDGFDPFK